MVARALEKSPTFRYQTARAMYNDLREIARELEGTPRTRTSRVKVGLMPQPRVESSVAVMTFANITREPADDWIGTGIAETVSSDLKNIDGLTVIGRARVFDALRNLSSDTRVDDSMAIANSDDVHALGFRGAGINVAVWENGPDSTANLAIAGRFTTSPSTSDHSRHVHGIIRNTQAGAPRGHARSCRLFSANDMDLDALEWAVEDEECTVINQSFHRRDEAREGTMSFDDIFKELTPHLARQRQQLEAERVQQEKKDK